MSSRSQSTVGAVNSPQDLISGLDHRPQAAHSHYRHNSKAQGQYQHSRNTSYVNSPATSPLSPQNGGSYSANGVSAPEFSSLTIVHHGTPNRRPIESPSSTLIATSNHSSTSTLGGDREQGDGSAMMNTQKKLDRGNSGKGRRGHNHHRSQSKQQFMQEPTTVGEYALQHLFEAVGNPSCPLAILGLRFDSLYVKLIIKSTNAFWMHQILTSVWRISVDLVWIQVSIN